MDGFTIKFLVVKIVDPTIILLLGLENSISAKFEVVRIE